MPSKLSSKRLNRTQFILLGMLSRKDSSGYDLAKAIKSSTAFFWDEGFGQIYPTLKKLNNGGLVEVSKDKNSEHRRLVYKITSKGRNELKKWLVEPYKPTVERNELLLKIFFSEFTDPAVVLKHVQRAKFEALEYRKVLDNIQSKLKKKILNKRKRFYLEWTVRVGQKGSDAQAAWCEQFESEIIDLFKLKK